MKSRIVLMAFGLAAAFILLLIYRREHVFHSQSTASSNIHDSVFHSRSTSSDSTATEIKSPRQTSMEQIGASGTGMSSRPVSPAEIPKLYLELTENSDPAASQLFKECFELMDHGNYREAGSKLVAFMEGPIDKNKFIAPAWWMYAWCVLKEGGKEKDAASRFWIYYHQWPGPGEYDELTKAALFNSAAIYTDLLYTAQENQDEYNKNAKEALNSFLAKWPNDPRASEATNLLNSLNSFHPKP
jgi:TolA-binding protein